MRKFKKPEFDLSSLKTGAALLGGATILYFGMKKIANALIDFKIQESNAELHKRAEIASDLMRAHSAQTEHKPAQDSDNVAYSEWWKGYHYVVNSNKNQYYYDAIDQIHFYGTVGFRHLGDAKYDFTVSREEAKNLPFFRGETDCPNKEELKYLQFQSEARQVRAFSFGENLVK